MDSRVEPHILIMCVSGDDAGLACADIDALLDESESVGAWPDGVKV